VVNAQENVGLYPIAKRQVIAYPIAKRAEKHVVIKKGRNAMSILFPSFLAEGLWVGGGSLIIPLVILGFMLSLRH